MTRFVRRRAAACLAAGLVTSLVPLCGAPPAHSAEEEEPTTDPLQVTIDRVGPSTIPTRGRVTLSGTVTNTTESTWSDLNLYLLTSFEPMRTPAELAAAAELDPLAYIGDRLADPGQFVTIPDLEPGASTRFTISRPRDELNISGASGVYWVGVQVLGADESGRVDGADGRARTIVPLMRPRNPPSTQVALVVPFRARMSYDASGAVLTDDVWHEAISSEGRLGRLLELTRSAGDFPVRWAIDPAFIDLVRALARDNPGIDLGPTEGTSPSGSPTDEPSPTEEPDEEEPDLSADALAAQAFLDVFLDEARSRGVLTLPYGDVDVAGAALQTGGGILRDAITLAEETLADLDIASTPVVDPPEGTLPWEAIGDLGQDVPALLNDSAVDAATTRVDTSQGAHLTRTSTAAVRTLPGSPPALAMRQRILAEAAVHALSPRLREEPMVVELPDRWDPGSNWQRAAFFRGLDVPWLVGADAVGIVRSLTSTTIEQGSESLRYPDDAVTLPATNFIAQQELVQRGEILDRLLPRNNEVGRKVEGFSYLGVSGQFLDVPGRAKERVEQMTTYLRGLMGQVTLSGPTFVTMSSENGEFQVTVTNGLDQPVTVGVTARSPGNNEITIPATEPITIPAGERRSVRMQANTERIGLWPIVLQAVTEDGEPIGGGTDLDLRSSHVGRFVWGILGGGTLVLLVLIFFRVRRKVRARQATPGPILKQAEE